MIFDILHNPQIVFDVLANPHKKLKMTLDRDCAKGVLSSHNNGGDHMTEYELDEKLQEAFSRGYAEGVADGESNTYELAFNNGWDEAIKEAREVFLKEGFKAGLIWAKENSSDD